MGERRDRGRYGRVALVLASLLVGVACGTATYAVGAWYGLAEGNAQLGVGLSSSTVQNLCTPSATECPYRYYAPGGQTYVAGIAPIPDRGRWVAVILNGPLEELSPNGTPLNQLNFTCETRDIYYPGSGDLVYVACVTPAAYPPTLHYVVEYNWSSEAIQARVQTTYQCEGGMTWDPAVQRLLCSADSTSPTEIMLVDPVQGMQSGVLPFSRGVPGQLLFDPTAGGIVASTAGGGELDLLNASTGAFRQDVTVPGVPIKLALTPDGRNIVAYDVVQDPVTHTINSDVVVLNASSLEMTRVIPCPSGAFPEHSSITFVPSNPQALLVAGPNLVAIDYESGEVAQAPLPGYVSPGEDSAAIGGNGSTMAYGQLEEARPGAWLAIVAISATDATGAPYSAVPVLGAGTPVVVGAAATGASLGLFVIFSRLHQQKQIPARTPEGPH